ncbi:flagellar hook-basal body complex protein FliE [Polaromonas sp. A23]|nr:flagellar hook-basal body complex protein FliE [Polaromonas sp. A23]
MIDIVSAIQSPNASLAVQQPTQSDFSTWFSNEIARANQALGTADSQLKQLAAGDPIPVHEVMLSLEEAQLTFQLVTQVRNRLLEAYQDILKMQI